MTLCFGACGCQSHPDYAPDDKPSDVMVAKNPPIESLQEEDEAQIPINLARWGYNAKVPYCPTVEVFNAHSWVVNPK